MIFSLIACERNKENHICVKKTLLNSEEVTLDTTFLNSHFGDIITIIPKDSLCHDTNVYTVLIVKIYAKDKKTRLCRLLDNDAKWIDSEYRKLTLKTKILEFNILKHKVINETTLTSDSTALSKINLPTLIVDSKLVEM